MNNRSQNYIFSNRKEVKQKSVKIRYKINHKIKNLNNLRLMHGFHFLFPSDLDSKILCNDNHLSPRQILIRLKAIPFPNESFILFYTHVFPSSFILLIKSCTAENEYHNSQKSNIYTEIKYLRRNL